MMKLKAFSLMELLCVLLIIGILSSIAAPSYLHYRHRAARKQAVLILLQASAKLAQYHFKRHTYVGVPLAALSLSVNNAKDYQFILKNQSQTDYLLQAKPRFKDAKCGVLAINAQHLKTVTGVSSKIDCW